MSFPRRRYEEAATVDIKECNIVSVSPLTKYIFSENYCMCYLVKVNDLSLISKSRRVFRKGQKLISTASDALDLTPHTHVQGSPLSVHYTTLTLI